MTHPLLIGQDRWHHRQLSAHKELHSVAFTIICAALSLETGVFILFYCSLIRCAATCSAQQSSPSLRVCVFFIYRKWGKLRASKPAERKSPRVWTENCKFTGLESSLIQTKEQQNKPTSQTSQWHTGCLKGRNTPPSTSSIVSPLRLTSRMQSYNTWTQR